MRAKCFLVVALVLAGATAWGHWDPEMPAKWVQRPDLEPTGMDVYAMAPMILADDFLCKETGHIVGVHVWASWYHDILPFGENPTAVAFRLQIWSDVPAGPDQYSHPGELLWEQHFQPGQFTVRPFAENLMEGWYNPAQEFYDPFGDTICWQYNFHIPTEIAFLQEGKPEEPVVYWLAVSAMPEDDRARFGWKSSMDHWNDDAVWGGMIPWQEMRYPPEHPLEGQSVDLAFVIQSEPVVEPDHDFGDAPDAVGTMHNYQTLLINDGAQHLINRQMYLGLLLDAEFDGQPTLMADGDDINGLPDEDGVILPPALIPGFPADIVVTASMDGKLDAWCDFGADGMWNAGDQIFAGEPLTAGANALSFMVPPHAVAGARTYLRFRYSSVGGLPPFGPAPDGEVEDYAIMIEYPPEAGDLGDAPDSTNSFGLTMSAYPGVPGRFPTVFVAGSPPWGPMHWNPHPAHLGRMVSLEVEADMGPDQDGVNNLDVPNNAADLDGHDDGVLGIPLNLPHCYFTQFEYLVSIDGPAANRELYVNVWFDWNRDGDWNDTLHCRPNGQKPVPEWAVQNQMLVGLSPGIHTITTPGFLSWHPRPVPDEGMKPIWMRITLAEQPWSPAMVEPGSGGSGPANGYELGETEDYFFLPTSECVRCADLDCNQFVNIIDFAILASQWLTWCP